MARSSSFAGSWSVAITDETERDASIVTNRKPKKQAVIEEFKSPAESIEERKENSRKSLQDYFGKNRNRNPFRFNSWLERIATWGVPLPMSEEERIIHKRMLRSVIDDNRREKAIMPWRQEVSLGIWGIGDDIRVEVGLLQPCIATATIAAEDVTQEEVDDCFDKIVRVHDGTSNWKDPNLGAVDDDPKVRLKGRMSLTIIDMLRKEGRYIERSRPTFVNISGSALNVILRVKEKIYICCFTKETLKSFPSERDDTEGTLLSEQHNIRFKFRLSEGYKETYFRIDSAGVIGLVGKPPATEEMLARIQYMIHQIMNDTAKTITFIRSLRVVQEVKLEE